MLKTKQQQQQVGKEKNGEKTMYIEGKVESSCREQNKINRYKTNE